MFSGVAWPCGKEAAGCLRARQRIHADGRIDVGADAGVAAVALELLPAIRAGRHQRKHAAGRVAGDGDPVGVDAEAGGVRARPADRGFDVVNLRRPGALRLQPVVGRDVRVASGPERLRVVDDVAGVLVADEKPTAEQVNDRHALRRDACRRLVDVEREIHAPALAEDDVLFDPQVPGVWRRGPLRVCGNRRENRCRGQGTRRLDESPPGKSRHISYLRVIG